MAAKDKYVAYVSCYTQGSPVGIRVYDADIKNGTLSEKEKIKNAEGLNELERAYVHVLYGKHIVKTGDFHMVSDIEKNGYKKYTEDVK